jgi:hypothetical protein
VDVSMDGRLLRGVANDAGGEVDSETIFRFHQQEDLVWAEYEGGAIRRGYLVGLVEDDTLDLRYAHVSVDGDTATGRTVDRVEVLADGRVRLHERWAWDSRDGEGTSVLEEIAPPLH